MFIDQTALVIVRQQQQQQQRVLTVSGRHSTLLIQQVHCSAAVSCVRPPACLSVYLSHSASTSLSVIVSISCLAWTTAR